MDEEERLEKLYDAHAEGLCRFLVHLTGNVADARDLLQELFIKWAKKPLPQLPGPELRKYMYRAAYCQFVDFRRRWLVRMKAWVAFLKEPSGGGVPEDDGRWDHLLSILAELPPEQRAVVHLKVWEEMTFAEIAHALGVSQNTAASRYRYALDKLRGRVRW